MPKIVEFIKQHKAAVAVGVAGVVGILLLRKGSNSSGSSSGGASTVQLAQIQASQNLQQAQLQAQQNEVTLGAQAQVDQTNAQLQGEQDELAVGLAQNLNQTGTQASLINEYLGNEEEQQSAYDNLVEKLSPEALATAVKGGNKNSETGLNELAILFGQEGQTGSFNSTFGGSSALNPLDLFLAELGSSASSLTGALAGL
jgi:hypothetical protein